MDKKSFQKLKIAIQLQAKNGVDFMVAASVIWLMISYIWTLDYTPYNKSILTFIIGALMLPLAFGLSKVLRTHWKVKDNPLDPLGLWLNVAQLFYFPFLIFVLIKDPDYFIMTYAIITGAHLFPYAWFYDEYGYAAAAVIISLGSLLIALNIAAQQMWYIPLFTSVCFIFLAVWIFFRWRKFKSGISA